MASTMTTNICGEIRHPFRVRECSCLVPWALPTANFRRPSGPKGDPACGTGGFLVAAYKWLIQQTKGALERDVAKRVKRSTYYGQDLVERPRRLASMNLYLHGLEPEIALGDAPY